MKQIIYHTGYLPIDRKEDTKLDRMASGYYAKYEAKLGTLVQRIIKDTLDKKGFPVFQYIYIGE